MQLSLAFPSPFEERQHVWFLSASASELQKVREALQDSLSSMLDARSGLRAFGPHDLVLLRTGDDRYESFGSPGALAAFGRLDGDWTARLAALLAEGEQSGRDLLCLAKGRTGDSAESLPGTPIEELFRLLRSRKHRLSAPARKALCGRALDTLGADHATLAAVLRVQAARLDRLVPTEYPVTGLPAASGNVRPAWLARAQAPRLARGAPVVRDLFGSQVNDAPARDISYGAIRVSGISVAIAHGKQHRDFSRFEAHAPVRLDETALSAALAPLTSFRIVASAQRAPGDVPAIEMRIDYEVRRRFHRLARKSHASDCSWFRLETLAGDGIGGSRMAKLGEDVHLDVPAQWLSPRRVRGIFVYTAGGGQWARHAVDLPISA